MRTIRRPPGAASFTCSHGRTAGAHFNVFARGHSRWNDVSGRERHQLPDLEPGALEDGFDRKRNIHVRREPGGLLHFENPKRGSD